MRLRWLPALVFLPLLLGADKCPIAWPPAPSPTPTVTPAPTPTPTPTPTQTPVPTPTPTPTSTPTPTPTPTPQPTPTPTPPPVATNCVPEGVLVADSCSVPELQNEVAFAIGRVGAPKPTPQASIKAVALELNREGFCATAGSEAVFVMKPNGLHEEYHVVAFGAPYGWTNSGKGKYIGCHRDKTRKQGVCGPPAVPGNSNLAINVKYYSKFVDGTIVAKNACEYCRLAGVGWNGKGVPRCGCPMRGDGNVERVACENAASKNGPTWQTLPQGKEIVEHNGNPWQVACVGCAQLRACSTDLGVCSVWIDQP